MWQWQRGSSLCLYRGLEEGNSNVAQRMSHIRVFLFTGHLSNVPMPSWPMVKQVLRRAEQKGLLWGGEVGCLMGSSTLSWDRAQLLGSARPSDPAVAGPACRHGIELPESKLKSFLSFLRWAGGWFWKEVGRWSSVPTRCGLCMGIAEPLIDHMR